ncbi:MAG: hypothetical protein JWN37_908 [Candidatus Nomurabacteria bacterium]|nr:hypothetical protein [Candidatus Nomurabacteria bacterium]
MKIFKGILLTLLVIFFLLTAGVSIKYLVTGKSVITPAPLDNKTQQPEESATTSWVTVETETFKASFPIQPTHFSKEVPAQEEISSDVYQTLHGDATSSIEFNVTAIVYKPRVDIPSNFADSALQSYLQGLNGTLISSSYSNSGKNHTLNFLMSVNKKGPAYAKGKFIVSGERLYVVSSSYSSQYLNSPDIDQFINSFQIK